MLLVIAAKPTDRAFRTTDDEACHILTRVFSDSPDFELATELSSVSPGHGDTRNLRLYTTLTSVRSRNADSPNVAINLQGINRVWGKSESVRIEVPRLSSKFIPPKRPWQRSNGGYIWNSEWEKCSTKTTCDGDPSAPRYFRHVGIDIRGRSGEAVAASADGWVRWAKTGSNYEDGGVVVLEHDSDGDIATTTDRITTAYLHVIPEIAEGSWVVQGTRIARVQAIQSGSHLHFGFRRAPFNDRDPSPSLRGALPPPGTSTCTCCTCRDKKRSLPSFPEKWENPESIVGLAVPP